MAHPVIDDSKLGRVEPTKTITKFVHQALTKAPTIMDSIVLLTIAFWYFFFTGLAILFGKEIPPKWLKIAVYLSRGKIAKKIQDIQEKKQNSIKVVDLETQQPITLKP